MGKHSSLAARTHLSAPYRVSGRTYGAMSAVAATSMVLDAAAAASAAAPAAGGGTGRRAAAVASLSAMVFSCCSTCPMAARSSPSATAENCALSCGQGGGSHGGQRVGGVEWGGVGRCEAVRDGVGCRYGDGALGRRQAGR